MKKAKKLKLVQALEGALDELKAARAAVQKNPSEANTKRLEAALTQKVAALAALEAVDEELAAKVVTEKKSEKTSEKTTDDDEDEEAEDDSDEEDAEDDSDEGDASAEDDEGESTTGSTSAEGDDKEEKSLAAAFEKASGPGLYSPLRLLRVCQKVTKQTSIKGVFGALDGMGQRLKAAGKLERRVAKLEGSNREGRVSALIAEAKKDGRLVGKARVDAARADGLRFGASWLKGHLATLPRTHRVLAEGDEFQPRTDTNGNAVLDRDSARIMDDATAGMSPDEAKKFRAEVAARIAANGTGATPRH